MQMNMKPFTDPFLRKAEDIKCPLGLTPFDAVRIQPGPGLARTFERVRDEEQRDYSKQSDLILSCGCAVGLDDDGNVQHYYAGRVGRFVGFLLAQTASRATVRTRGSIVLKVEGATADDRGAAVYCISPNEFTIKKVRGAAEIGVVRYEQGGRFAVAFRRYDSEKPLDLRLA